MLPTDVSQGPDLNPRPPRFKVPPGATDTHFHVFGPQDSSGLVEEREYTPPLITPALAAKLFAIGNRPWSESRPSADR